DDAILSQDLRNALNEIKLIDSVRKPNVFLLSPPESYIKNIRLKSRKYNIHSIYEASGAYGYIINNKSAKQLIRRMVILPFFMEVKSRIQATRNKCCFGVYPPNAILGLS
ncbi:hypothetical protein, partial [Xenorhabdus bovienii]|nr:hypothetical protein [Xenorhabdus bovienii]